MRIGIIAEGNSDIAVITNIIKGIIDIDSNDIVPLRPILQYDNTDRAHQHPDTFSNWTLVKKECIEQTKIEGFLSQEDNKFVVIHIDADVAPQYGVEKPTVKDHSYCTFLRNSIVDKFTEWLGGKYLDEIVFAIAIEQTDAWLLTLYDTEKTCFITDPKRKFEKVLNNQNLKYAEGRKPYLVYSDDFKNPNKIKRKKCLENNCSLNAFYEDIRLKITV